MKNTPFLFLSLRGIMPVLAATLALGLSIPAFAADEIIVTSYTGLQAACASTATYEIVKLGGDIEDGDTQLTIGHDLTLDLNGKNLTITVTSGNGIKIASGKILTITDSSSPSTGVLTVYNSSTADVSGEGAGINTTDGSLIIESGTLSAIGGRGAGIGGGHGDAGGNITISGTADVGAAGGGNGAGIGGGWNGAGGTITINGSVIVQANGGGISAAGLGAGIGGGNSGAGGIITISGNATVTTRGGRGGGAGIGGGLSGRGGNITISGGNIIATGVGGGSGIGGGNGREGGDITISGTATVTANGGSTGGAGIGGGYQGDAVTVTISGGNITATGSGGGAGIGSGRSSTGGTGLSRILITGETTVVKAVGGVNAQDIGFGNGGSGTLQIFVALLSANLTLSSPPKTTANDVLFTANLTSNGTVTATLPTPFNAAPFTAGGVYNLLSGLTTAGETMSVITTLTASVTFALTTDYDSVTKTSTELMASGAAVAFITAPTITTTTLQGGTIGTEYSQTLATNVTAPITWSRESGSLPNGLSLDTATGEISGTPTTAGTSTFTVKALNSAGNDTKQLSIVIGKASQAALSITGLGGSYSYGDGTFNLSTEGGTGNGAVTYTSSDVNVASVSGNTVTILKAGTFKITATKAADNEYNQASVTSNEVAVSQSTPGVSLTASGGANITDPIILTATVSAVGTGVIPSGNVTFKEGTTELGTVALASGIATFTVNNPSAGDHIYTVEYPGELTRYNASSANVTRGVGLATQATLYITAPPAKTYGDASFTLTTSGGDGTGLVTFSVPPGNDVLNIASNGTFTIVGAGDVTVTATKAADVNYNEATATREITVSRRDIGSVTVTVAPNQTYTGSQLQPTFGVSDNVSISTGDYTNTYGTNIDAGTNAGSITLTGQGNYTGSKTVYFDILPTLPGAPTAVTATAGNGEATVTFTAPTNNGGSAITSYTVTAVEDNTKSATGTTIPITVTSLTNGTAYTFTVTATNSVGNSAASGASTPVTPATVPDTPTDVTATAGNGEATVAFTAPTDDGGSPITIYTVTSSGGQTATGTTIPITVTGLTNGTAYTFTVTATNDVGNSVPSVASTPVTPTAPVTVTPNPDPIHVTGVSLNLARLTGKAGDDAVRLVVTITPSYAANKDVIWSTSNPLVATVDYRGLVKFISPGKAKITVTTVDGLYTATCLVTVSTATDTEEIDSALKVYLRDHILYVSSTAAETVEVYSFSGERIFSAKKDAGEATFIVPTNLKAVIVHGTSGWTKKTGN